MNCSDNGYSLELNLTLHFLPLLCFEFEMKFNEEKK